MICIFLALLGCSGTKSQSLLQAGDATLEVHVSIEQEFFAWMDPVMSKKVLIKNSSTKEQLELAFESIEVNLLFYVNHHGNSIAIVDPYLGLNQYSIDSFKLLSSSGSKDCFDSELGGCGGFSEQGIRSMGSPDLVFTANGF